MNVCSNKKYYEAIINIVLYLSVGYVTCKVARNLIPTLVTFATIFLIKNVLHALALFYYGKEITTIKLFISMSLYIDFQHPALFFIGSEQW